MNDRSRFDINLAGLAETFEKELSEFLVLIYQKAMEPFSDDQVERALMTASLTMKFFPKPVELIELIQGNSNDNALVAWETLLLGVQRYGSYQSVTFTDGKIARAVDLMGGWFEVCAMTEEETKWRMKDFCNIYQSLPPSEPRKLVGRYEQDNRIRGFIEAVSDPILIGDDNGRKLLRLELA